MSEDGAAPLPGADGDQTGQNACPTCAGSGAVDGKACRTCDGSGLTVEPVGDA